MTHLHVPISRIIDLLFKIVLGAVRQYGIRGCPIFVIETLDRSPFCLTRTPDSSSRRAWDC
jgi:hypothetical protein